MVVQNVQIKFHSSADKGPTWLPGRLAVSVRCVPHGLMMIVASNNMDGLLPRDEMRYGRKGVEFLNSTLENSANFQNLKN